MNQKNIIFSFIILSLILMVSFLALKFISPASPVGLPNPASVNCEEVGGTLEIRTDSNGGQTGYCTLPDKTVCEEWALLRNECRPAKCVDCGVGGWQKMSEVCVQPVPTKNDARGCFINFSWSSVTSTTNIDEIKDGYIEIGGLEVLKNPTIKSIKVFIYHQWAIDEEGNLYLLGQLG